MPAVSDHTAFENPWHPVVSKFEEE